MSAVAPPDRKRRACLIAIGLGAVPFVFDLLLIRFWDRVYPLVAGMPFNLFWMLAGLVVTSACLVATYWLAPLDSSEDPEKP